MILRFYMDLDAGVPHCYAHGVDELEVEQALMRAVEDAESGQESRTAIGRTVAGRVLKIIYSPDPEPDSVFIITAFPLAGKALVTFNRRQRRKGRR